MIIGSSVLTILASIVVYGIARRTLREPGRPDVERPEPYLSRASGDQKEGSQRALLTIRPTGFDPREINRAPGAFLLAVDNRSGNDAVTLHLSREGGVRLRDVPLTRGHLKWREKINLPPGEYSLTEENHPDWSCRITIVP